MDNGWHTRPDGGRIVFQGGRTVAYVDQRGVGGWWWSVWQIGETGETATLAEAMDAVDAVIERASGARPIRREGTAP
jgi:hypothetical protein